MRHAWIGFQAWRRLSERKREPQPRNRVSDPNGKPTPNPVKTPPKQLRIAACLDIFCQSDLIGPGGTANLAVLGGNLPPSAGQPKCSLSNQVFALSSVGLAARQDGQAARSPQT